MQGEMGLPGSDVEAGSLPLLARPEAWARPARGMYLMALDLSALILCGTIAYVGWARPVHAQAAGLYTALIPLIGLFLIGYSLFGLYPGSGLGGVELIRRITLVTSYCFFSLAAATFALKLPHAYSRMTFAIAVLAALIVVPVVRYLAVHRARRWSWWRKPVVLIADDGQVAAAAAALAPAGGSDYEVVGIVHTRPDDWRGSVSGIPVLGPLSVVGEVARRGVSIAIVVAEHSNHMDLLDNLRRHFRHVLIVGSYSDVALERVQVRNLGRTIGIEYANNLLVPGNRILKRTLDVLGASAVLILSAPIIAVGMLVARLGSPGPALYYQVRRGFRDRQFRMPKIRTMYQDAEQQLTANLATSETLNRDWQDSFKLKEDPRVVPVAGTLLRRLSLDELPQLVSVLKGDMSLVGPRPLPDYHLEALSDRVRELRAEVRPGITGLWQVSGRSASGIAEQEARDEYYIRNWTIWLDVYVLGKTVGAVISGRGAY